MMKISNALIASLAEEQTIESVTEADELRYSNAFADMVEMDFFLEDDKTEVENSRSKTEKSIKRKKAPISS